MIKQFAHICIHTKNLKKTEEFYCNILKFPKKYNFNKDGSLFGFYIDTGNNNFLEFFLDEEVKANQSHLRHLCFEVENIDNVIDELKLNGVEVSPKALGTDNSWQCWITDPNGIHQGRQVKP